MIFHKSTHNASHCRSFPHRWRQIVAVIRRPNYYIFFFIIIFIIDIYYLFGFMVGMVQHTWDMRVPASQPDLSTSAASPWRGPGQRWALLRVPTRIPPLCLPAPAWGVRPVISTTADFDLDLPRKKASYTFGPLLGPPHQYNVQAQTETALGKLQSRTQTAV